MTKHMPEAPYANCSAKGPGDRHEASSDSPLAEIPGDVDVAEQGEVALALALPVFTLGIGMKARGADDDSG